MEYRSFEEIELPNLTVTEANPSHNFDFRKFSSDQVKNFNYQQVKILNDYSPGRPISITLWVTLQNLIIVKYVKI